MQADKSECACQREGRDNDERYEAGGWWMGGWTSSVRFREKPLRFQGKEGEIKRKRSGGSVWCSCEQAKAQVYTEIDRAAQNRPKGNGKRFSVRKGGEKAQQMERRREMQNAKKTTPK